nr:response regulator [Algicola sagamiensis]
MDPSSKEYSESLTSVLVVDDEYFNFEMLSASFSPRFDLNYVDSGAACLEYAVAHQPDVILLDVCMPGLNGYDICRLLKNTPETKHIPIIMVSGLDTDAEKQTAFEAGCDEYITKPFSISDLIDLIDYFVRQSQRSPQL